jgi:hypothetical protein
MNSNKELVSDALCLCIFFFIISIHGYMHLLNFEDEIFIRGGECSIPDFNNIIWKIII